MCEKVWGQYSEDALARSVRKIDRSVLGSPEVVRAVRPIGGCIRVRVVDQFPAR
jgi:hypothetical protein